ncbi:MAG TPA: D-alanyl-D-alanine carboxypeptidase/D-alanyl-D-alanine-endopeptidase [Chitinispirillaceae bacterium]|nr:D-alanyl-D-alanine carboxypeptidase/D-alanyl-D-alanine-endopeptidase [Chitinispirillaceae bacterium]
MLRVAKNVVLSCLLPCIIAGAPLPDIQKSMENFVAVKKYNVSGAGIVFKEVESTKPAVSINGEQMLNPASVAKLVTASAAFELLKTNYSFKTGIFISGSFDPDSGVVSGDLYIRGGGDPGFTAERLWLLVQHLQHRGIKKISGNLILDDFFFDTVLVGPGFDEDSNSRAYQPLICALSASFNTLAIHVRPGKAAGSPVGVDIFPKIAGVSIQSSAKTVSPGSKVEIDVVTIPSKAGTSVVVKGGCQVNTEPSYIYRKIWQSWEMFGGAVMAQFNDAGIKVNGTTIHGKVPESLRGKPFYEFESQPLNEFINHMFKYSSNFASEMIFKTISSQDNLPGSWERSSEIVKNWWKSNDLPGEPVIRNGSGMGNTNRISAGQIVELLDHVWSQKMYLPEYLSALSISGVDGTLKSRFKNSPLKGLIRGKTGTLNSYGVSTIAGYMLLPQGTWAFAILCNKVGNGQYDNWVTQEAIAEKFYEMVKK